MEFTDEPLRPLGRTLLEMDLETDLGCKTALVFRVVKLLQRNAFLPRYGCHMAEVAFEEVLANAMIHGNKLDPGKKVHVALFADGQKWGLLVSDEGEGFSPREIPDPSDPETMMREHGRGIMLMDYYMERVRYNRAARTIWMVRGPQAEPDPGAKPPIDPPRAVAVAAHTGPLSIEGLDEPDQAAATRRHAHIDLPDEIDLIAAFAPAGPTGGGDGSPVLTELRDGVLVARIHARRLSEDNAALVREQLLAAAGAAPHIVIDMSELEFMSSIGIGTIMTVWKQAREKKGRLVLTGVGPALQNILRATGLLKALAVEPTVAAAVAKARSG